MARSQTEIISGLLLSVLLHAPALGWLGLHLFERANQATISIYEIELLPEPLRPAASAELPRTPPAIARAADLPLPQQADQLEPMQSPQSVLKPQKPSGQRRAPGVPAAARAGRVLTAPEQGSGEPDPLDFTVVQGEGSRYAGGVTAAAGTSDRPVYDPRARGGGAAAPSRRGAPSKTAAAQPVKDPKTPSKKRSALPLSTSWNCPFPAEADNHDINFARVLIVVTVRASGTASSAAVLSDPGFGFARAARRCALHQQYRVAHDSLGRPTLGTTPPFTVTFTR